MNDGLKGLNLSEVGIEPLPGEGLEAAAGLEGGVSEKFERRHAILLLTNQRLIRYSAGSHNVSVVAVDVGDVDAIDVHRTTRNLQWVWVGTVFISGGLLLGLLSVYTLASSLSPLLISVALALIGIVFMLTYLGGVAGTVVVSAGLRDIKCKMNPKKLGEMVPLLQRYHELKSGASRGSNGA